MIGDFIGGTDGNAEESGELRARGLAGAFSDVGGDRCGRTPQLKDERGPTSCGFATHAFRLNRETMCRMPYPELCEVLHGGTVAYADTRYLTKMLLPHRLERRSQSTLPPTSYHLSPSPLGPMPAVPNSPPAFP